MNDQKTVTGAFAPSRSASVSKLGIAIVGLILLIAAFGVFFLSTHQKKRVEQRVALNSAQLAAIDIKNAPSGQSKALAYIRQANNLTDTKDYRGALKSYIEADKTWPNQPLVLSDIGDAYFKLHDKANTIKYYQRAIDVVQKDAKSEYKSNIATWQSTIKQAQIGNYEYTHDAEKA